MNTDSLRYFLEIAECKSFTRAACNLFISQQGLSKSLAKLEDEVGAQLFQRKGKRIELTQPGQVMLPHAQEIIQKEEQLKHAMMCNNASQHNDSFENLSLYTMPYVSNSLFNLLEQDIHNNKFDSCSVFEINFPEVITALESDNSLALCNFCVDDLELIKSNKNIEFIPLFMMNLVVLASRELVSPSIKEMPPHILAKLPLAHYNDPVLNKIVSHLFEKENSHDGKLLLRTTNHQKIISLLREGKAVTFSDTFSSHIIKRKGDIISIPMNPPVTVAIGFMINSHVGKQSAQIEYIKQFKTMLDIRYGTYIKRHAANF